MDKSLTEIESQVISLTHQFLLESSAERAARAVSLDARLEHDLGLTRKSFYSPAYNPKQNSRG